MRSAPSRRVLAIEDQALILLLLEEVLTEAGCHVIGAATEKDALAVAQDDPPDLVVMEPRLQGQFCGVELLRRLRALTSSPLPAIVVTGWHLTHDQRLSLGSDGTPVSVLSKPFDPDELAAEVRSLLR